MPKDCILTRNSKWPKEKKIGGHRSVLLDTMDISRKLWSLVGLHRLLFDSMDFFGHHGLFLDIMDFCWTRWSFGGHCDLLLDTMDFFRKLWSLVGNDICYRLWTLDVYHGPLLDTKDSLQIWKISIKHTNNLTSKL